MKVRNGYGLGFTTFSRMILGAALALAILGGGILSACGGSTPDEGSDPTQPPSENQAAPTAQPAAETPAPARVSTSEQKKLFLSADQFDEVEVELTAGDLLRVVYTSAVSISPGLGGTGHQERGVHLVVLDPNQEQLITAEESADNSVDVVVEVTGRHEIVFINPNQLEGLNVNLEYFINP